eukprot:Skav218491  [mRNA]  locus=scaffold538:1322239:1324362:- [translate_table: standard]
MTFSFTIADPRISGCPLIGCSTGFGTLCGYTMDDIVGRQPLTVAETDGILNCRFLVDPVPSDKIDVKMRKHAKDQRVKLQIARFCRVIPELEREDWMPIGRAGDELFCYQVNARKELQPWGLLRTLREPLLSSWQWFLAELPIIPSTIT